jgi:hypothetical protein
MTKRISDFTRPHENINAEKPDRKNIEAQIEDSHKAIRDAIKHHNTKGPDIDKETSESISDQIRFHATKIASLKELK